MKMKGKILLGMVLVLALLMVPAAFAGGFEIGGDFTTNDKATIPCKAVKGLMHSPHGERVVLDVFLGRAGLNVETGCL